MHELLGTTTLWHVAKTIRNVSYRIYRKSPKVQPPVAQIEWRGNLALLDKPEDPNMDVATLMATIKMNFGGLGI